MTLTDRIKKLRRQEKITQHAIAEKIKISLSTYKRHERSGKFTVKQIYKISEVLNVNPQYIINGEGYINDEINFRRLAIEKINLLVSNMNDKQLEKIIRIIEKENRESNLV